MTRLRTFALVQTATLALATQAARAADPGMTMGALGHAKARVAGFVADIALARQELASLAAAASDELMTGDGVRAATYLLILLMIGCGAEWYYWTFAYGPVRAIEAAPVANPRQAANFALRRFLLIVFGLAIFTLATLGASAAFSWPPGLQETVVTATLVIVSVRAALIVSLLLFSWRPESLRLVAMSTRRARWLTAGIGALAAIAAIGGLVAELLERSSGAPHAANALRLICVTLAALLLLIAAAMGARLHPRDASTALPMGDLKGFAAHRRRLPKFPRHILISLLVIATWGLWVFAGPKTATIVAILIAVVAAQGAMKPFVFSFWRDRIEAAKAEAPDDSSLDPTLIAGVALAVARLVVVLIGIAATAVALDLPLQALAMSDIPAVRFGIKALEVLALILLTNVAWVAIRTKIDQRLRQIGPFSPHDEPGPNARLLTLLPILRLTAFIVLAVMLGLSAMWAIGIEVTPLLAGAGVLGLAVGFGAQALVRDVISGIFYLAEDVFRVGEYIESGTTTKGTVERITLRTVALRHHNGPLHFVPYGSLGVVRNNSRDWVVEKFNLPLPIHVDSEQIRKIIKKVGEAMLEDPEIGPMMREPLKGKIYRIDPGVKIFRCKFETAPGKQFDVRADAFRRIEAKLKEAGVSFADGAQTVLMNPLAESPEPRPASASPLPPAAMAASAAVA